MNMMKTVRFFLVFLAAFAGLTAQGQREDRLLNEAWKFRFSHQVNMSDARRVDLPHTWNTVDALAGQPDYKRGIGNYTRKLHVPASWRGRRLFLKFEGANAVTNVFVNGKMLGEHRGGYGAFVFELTGRVEYGKDNEILVRVNNGEQLDVMPLVGDFTMYGGIYRDVHLLLTDAVCISPLDHASSGIYLVQRSVTDEKADVTARILLSNAGERARNVQLRLKVLEGDKAVYETDRPVVVAAGAMVQEEKVAFSLRRPRLWDGVSDPFMYRAVVTLEHNGRVLDSVEQPLGLRYYHVDADKGFCLNGKYLPLRGVCRHQERAEAGNALRPEHHDEDIRLMQEMGVNAVRLAHYPHASYFYDLMDRAGMVAWAEIPFVGPGGYADKGFVDQPAFRENGKQQLRELIRQHYNHPSICFWGIFNELKEQGDNPLDYIRELNALAHAEDSTRLTTAATNQDGAINYVTDLVAWNKYDGWYGATPKTLAQFLDRTHRDRPALRIGISEYGAGASIHHQQDTLVQTSPNSWWHPENWQTEYHIRNWEILSSRPYVWGSFVWNMFDFGAPHRTEGDRPGINDKGLVTHDRRVRKDAFYFYKANWNPQPMVRVAGRRNVRRRRALTQVQVFSNCPEITLRVNGAVVGRQRPDRVRVCTFSGIILRPGRNVIVAEGRSGRRVLTDTCCWVLE